MTEDETLPHCLRSSAFTAGPGTDKEIRYAYYKPKGINWNFPDEREKTFLHYVQSRYTRIGRGCFFSSSQGDHSQNGQKDITIKQAIDALAEYEISMLEKGWTRMDHKKNIYKNAFRETFNDAVDYKSMTEGVVASVPATLKTCISLKTRKLKPKSL